MTPKPLPYVYERDMKSVREHLHALEREKRGEIHYIRKIPKHWFPKKGKPS